MGILALIIIGLLAGLIARAVMPGNQSMGLVATTLLTLGMAVQWPVAWPLLRFLAGVASALVFVYTSGWCLAQLARLNASAMGGVMYAGPGAGIGPRAPPSHRACAIDRLGARQTARASQGVGS